MPPVLQIRLRLSYRRTTMFDPRTVRFRRQFVRCYLNHEPVSRHFQTPIRFFPQNRSRHGQNIRHHLLIPSLRRLSLKPTSTANALLPPKKKMSEDFEVMFLDDYRKQATLLKKKSQEKMQKTYLDNHNPRMKL